MLTFFNIKIIVILISLLKISLSSVSTMSGFSKFSIRQAINIPAIKKLSSLLVNPSLLIPTWELSYLSDLNLSHLKSVGIKALVFDKDNTLRLSLLYIFYLL
jgi:hypothetical protein